VTTGQASPAGRRSRNPRTGTHRPDQIRRDLGFAVATHGLLGTHRGRTRRIAEKTPRAKAYRRSEPTSEMPVKPSAQPTLVRTQHLPPPAEMTCDLGISGLEGRLGVVAPCVMKCHREPLHSSGYGHIADGILAEPAVHRTASCPGRGGHLARRRACRARAAASDRRMQPHTACRICQRAPHLWGF